MVHLGPICLGWVGTFCILQLNAGYASSRPSMPITTMNENPRSAVKLVRVSDGMRIAELFQGCSLKVFHDKMVVSDTGVFEEGDFISCVRMFVEADDDGYFVVLQELDSVGRDFLVKVVGRRGAIETARSGNVFIDLLETFPDVGHGCRSLHRCGCPHPSLEACQNT